MEARNAASQKVKEKSEELNKCQKDFNNKWNRTDSPIPQTKVPEGIIQESSAGTKADSKAISWMKSSTASLEKKKAVQEARKEAIASKADSISKWMDDLEAVLDSLPSFSKDPGTVYEVEERINKDTKEAEWYYTGNSEPMDVEQLEKLNRAKANVCAFLMKWVTFATTWIEDKLTEETNKLDNCEPYATAITVIMNPPSLTTIIKWATSVIDYVLATWKMIYGLFKSTLEVIEMIIIRAPMLINKLMGKITEFKCPIQSNVTLNKTSNVVSNDNIKPDMTYKS